MASPRRGSSRSSRSRWRRSSGSSRYERRRPEPLLEIRFFRSAPFSGASAIAVLAFAGLGGFLFLNTLYLQEVRHLSPFQAGLYTLPLAAMTLIFAPLSGRLTGGRGARLPLMSAGCALMLSPLMLTRLDPTTPTALLFASYTVYGIGFGLVNPPITNTAVSGMPPSQAGVAAAVASTSRQVGATLGVAVIGAVAGAGIGGAFGAQSSLPPTRDGGSSPGCRPACWCSVPSRRPPGRSARPGRWRCSTGPDPGRTPPRAAPRSGTDSRPQVRCRRSRRRRHRMRGRSARARRRSRSRRERGGPSRAGGRRAADGHRESPRLHAG